jgi:hypothetical protein
MAASTDTDALTITAYTLVATDAAAGMVQHMGGSKVRIHVGTSLPDAATVDYVLIGSEGDLPRTFSWTGYGSGDDVYARADLGTAIVSTVAVAAS